MATQTNPYWKDRIANNTWKAYNKAEIRNQKLVEMYKAAREEIYNELIKFDAATNTSRTAAYNYQRQLALQKHMNEVIIQLGYDIEKDFSDQMAKIMAMQYKSVSGEIQNGENFTMLKENIFKDVLKEPWKGNNFSGRLWNNQDKLSQALDQVILNGISAGKTITEMAVKLDGMMSNGLYNSYRLVRSETMHYLNQATLMAYKDRGVKRVEYLAALDERTCETCGPLNGKTYAISRAPILPIHPNCRCTYIPVIVDEKATTKAGERGTIDPDKRLEEFKKIYASSDKQNVPKFAKKILKKENINVPFKNKKIDANGQCWIDFNGAKAKLSGYELNSDDQRNFYYRSKTVFHELFHAKIDDLAQDSAKIGHKNYIDVEETFAESVAHYLAKATGILDDIKANGDLLGVHTDMSFSYSEKLVRNLPKLKKLDAFRDCETVADFGEVAYKYRFGDVNDITAEWEDISNHLLKTDFNLKDYASQYSEYIIKNKEEIINVILDNAPTYRSYKDMFVGEIESGFESLKNGVPLKGNEQTFIEQAMVVAMNRLGVK